MKLGIIGGGTMGSAFIRCVIQKGVVTPRDILVVESNAERRAALQNDPGCSVSAQPDKELSGCDAIVLAVKPQDFQSTAAALGSFLRSSALIVSFMAGIKLETISRLLAGQTSVVRVMPNLPFSIGQGMSVYIFSAAVDGGQIELTRLLLDSCGISLQVEDEGLLDAATAVSGTGPGYIFYFIEHLLQAAQELGFSGEQARLLIGQTLVGSIELWRQGEHTAEHLRRMVTSKNGTTAAALEVFEKGKLGQVMIAGIKRAGERARELAGH